MRIDEKDRALLERNRLLAAQNYSLTTEQLEWIYERKLFKLWVPKEFDGLEADFIDGIKTLEKLAYEDGSLAWTVTLCSGANLFVGYVDPKVHKLFLDEKICLGGSGFNSGVAEKHGEGYTISGEWKYATGSHHLTHFTLVAELWEDGKSLLDKNGQTRTAAFFVDANQVQIIEDWKTFGLESTASHSFSVKDAKVDSNREFYIDADKKTIDSPLFDIPFPLFAEATLLVNYIGIFRKFLDLVHFSFSRQPSKRTREGDTADKLLILEPIRNQFEADVNRYYKKVTALWSDRKYDDKDCEKSNVLAKDIVAFIKEKTAFLFPYCGIYAAQHETELNSVFRNIFTASQHNLLLHPMDSSDLT